ncbi:nucleoside recognition domain-containing protein [uncultured Ruminococcus sp.]|uniref:spore maturation protein n=1 Tax=uncultured Ruminococcus sp. TaxID=165186 RepID=UPI00293031A9|nr:nucleoside recognition domain-containing protein [uncultured Ruminococcus sp.]
MEAVIPIIITALCVYGLFKRVNIFDSFIEGAKEGFATVKFVAPTMIALLVAVGTLRASGALDYLAGLIRPLAEKVGFPAELVPMGLLRPVSGSGATALLTGIYENNGPDSFVGRCASVVAGSTETTFYAVSMYYGAAGITKIRHTLFSALLADFTAIVISVVAVGLLMS